jgi:cytoskeletal protein CcmA (bactofilin family)
MSVFRRRREETPAPASTPGEAAVPAAPVASATVPVARDPDLGVPPFRPVVAKEQPPVVPAPPKPTAAPLGGPALSGRPAVGPVAPAAPRPATRPEGAERRTLVVGKGISLQGTVSDAERLVVEGTVESQMITAAELIVAHAGVFKGEVQVEDAEIAGTFDGTVTATNTLVIRATGKVLGTARCRRLQVEEGGQLSGRMEMLTDAPPVPVRPMGLMAAPPPAPLPVRSPEAAEA